MEHASRGGTYTARRISLLGMRVPLLLSLFNKCIGHMYVVCIHASIVAFLPNI